MNEQKQSQIEGLATLLVLAEEIRKLGSIREFGFFSTNETHRLTPYHTSYLWQLKDFIGTHLIAQSGTAEIDVHAPANQWLIHKINRIRTTPLANEIHQITAEEDNATPGMSWPDELPNYMLWCPLLNKANKLTGGLIFFRESLFTETEVKMLTWLIASYQYTWLLLIKPQKLPGIAKFKERPYLIALLVTITAILLFPIRLSVLGDGTVTPKSPVLINAPLEGVIKSFSVKPGESVKAGELLLTFDKTELLASLEVSKKDYILTETKLRTAINTGFDNKDMQAEIPIIQAQLDIDKSNYNYAKKLLNKADVKSPINGIVIFESTEDWIGQPVHTGERILTVADPKQVQLKITLPISNVIDLSIKDKGEFFLYGQLSSISFSIKSLGYNAKLLPNKVLAYQLTADFIDQDDLPQLGARGTVKIYGRYVPFIYYLLRRPLQAVRQTLGV